MVFKSIHPLQLNELCRSDNTNKQQKDTDSHRSLRGTPEDPQSVELHSDEGEGTHSSLA